MANIRKFTKAERILLEIEDKHKFKLSFNDMLKLREYIKLVGNITSFYFNIQSEFFDVTQDIHELENFNKRISNEDINVDFEFNDIVAFINNIGLKINDDGLNHLIAELNT